VWGGEGKRAVYRPICQRGTPLKGKRGKKERGKPQEKERKKERREQKVPTQLH